MESESGSGDDLRSELVEVTLSDAADGAVLARTLAPVGTLPPNFDGTQLLEFDQARWRVVQAEPACRDEYRLTGSLALLLRRVTETRTVDPAEVLFSMSSICDDLPDLDGPPDGESLLTVKDDLWRDVELVGPGNDAAIAANFAAIAEVQERFRSGSGFSRLHVRAEPRRPLAGVRIGLAELAEAFGATAHFLRPVAVTGAGVVRHGYALDVSRDVHVYGVADDRLTVVGVHRTGPADPRPAEALAGVLRGHGCELIDWRARLRFGGDDLPALVDWFASQPQPLWR